MNNKLRQVLICLIDELEAHINAMDVDEGTLELTASYQINCGQGVLKNFQTHTEVSISDLKEEI